MRRAKLAPTNGRLLAMAAKEELQATQQKFSVGANPLEREAFLKVLEPTYTKQLERLCELMELYDNTSPDPSKHIAVEMWRAQIAQGAFSDHAKMEFVRRFYYWLLGRAADKDAKRTFWGRANVAEHNDEVRAYIEMFVDKRAQFAQQMALLGSRLPSTLVGYYLYFKYIVDGHLKRVTDANGTEYWDMGPEDFLDDFEMFESEFNNKNDKQTLGRFNDKKPPFHGASAYPATQQEGKREQLLAFNDLHPEVGQVVKDEIAQKVVDGLWNLLHPVLKDRQPGREMPFSPIELAAATNDVEAAEARRDKMDDVEQDAAGRQEMIDALHQMTERLVQSNQETQAKLANNDANFAKLHTAIEGLPAAIAAAIADAMPKATAAPVSYTTMEREHVAVERRYPATAEHEETRVEREEAPMPPAEREIEMIDAPGVDDVEFASKDVEETKREVSKATKETEETKTEISKATMEIEEEERVWYGRLEEITESMELINREEDLPKQRERIEQARDALKELRGVIDDARYWRHHDLIVGQTKKRAAKFAEIRRKMEEMADANEAVVDTTEGLLLLGPPPKEKEEEDAPMEVSRLIALYTRLWDSRVAKLGVKGVPRPQAEWQNMGAAHMRKMLETMRVALNEHLAGLKKDTKRPSRRERKTK